MNSLPLALFYWDPKPEIFTIPFLHWPILWYGLLFALGFILGFPIFVGVVFRFFLQNPGSEKVSSLHKQATFIADRLAVYMVLATVIGARVGHFLFYERPSDYLSNPKQLLEIWKGGLASHGAAVAIVLALVLFAYRYKDRLRGLSCIHLLDFVSIPTALAGAFIRVGNFFNQEILGTMTDRPWAVVFGHPADHSLPAPRHPVQLYEAFFYAAVFLILWRLSFRPKYLMAKGKLIGLFLVLVFGFRLVIEIFKEEQSRIMPLTFDLTMGQILSLPAILIGLILLFRTSSTD